MLYESLVCFLNFPHLYYQKYVHNLCLKPYYAIWNPQAASISLYVSKFPSLSLYLASPWAVRCCTPLTVALNFRISFRLVLYCATAMTLSSYCRSLLWCIRFSFAPVVDHSVAWFCSLTALGTRTNCTTHHRTVWRSARHTEPRANNHHRPYRAACMWRSKKKKKIAIADGSPLVPAISPWCFLVVGNVCANANSSECHLVCRNSRVRRGLASCAVLFQVFV